MKIKQQVSMVLYKESVLLSVQFYDEFPELLGTQNDKLLAKVTKFIHSWSKDRQRVSLIVIYTMPITYKMSICNIQIVSLVQAEKIINC